jgi:hypothetical protein
MLLGCPSKGYHTVLARRLWCDAFERQRFEADGRLEEPGLLDPVLAICIGVAVTLAWQSYV